MSGTDIDITEEPYMNVDFWQPTIKKIVHKAESKLDRNGPAISPTSILPMEDTKEAILNIPFVFAILQHTLDIPVFVGVVSRMEDAGEREGKAKKKKRHLPLYGNWNL